MRVRPSYLRETACYLAEPGVGLVSNLFAGVGEVHASAVLENLQLNGFIAGGVAGAAVCGATCVVGKSMLMPVRALEAIGGFAAIRNVLAEDQVIGVRVRKAGYSIRLSHHVIENVNRQRSFRWFLNRHSRWYKIRRQMALADVPDRAGGQSGDRGLGLGVFGRFRDRLGRAAALGRPGNGARRHPDSPVARHVSQAAAPLVQPRERHPAAAALVRRHHEPARSVARPSLPGRPDDPAPAGPRSTSGPTTGVARPQVSRQNPRGHDQ